MIDSDEESPKVSRRASPPKKARAEFLRKPTVTEEDERLSKAISELKNIPAMSPPKLDKYDRPTPIKETVNLPSLPTSATVPLPSSKSLDSPKKRKANAALKVDDSVGRRTHSAGELPKLDNEFIEVSLKPKKPSPVLTPKSPRNVIRSKVVTVHAPVQVDFKEIEAFTAKLRDEVTLCCL